MSIQAMTAVWQNSRHSGSYLVLLLALADYANDQAQAWPSLRSLAAKARLSERHTRSMLRELEDSGELSTEIGAGPHGTNVYTILLPGAVFEPAVSQRVNSRPRLSTAPQLPTAPHPSSVIVSPVELQTENTITEGLGAAHSPPPAAHSPPQTANADDLLQTWQDYGLAGAWLTETALAIQRRPHHWEEVNDLLDYFDTWNEFSSKALQPGWIAGQLKELAALDPTEPRAFRWMNHAPEKGEKPEYWRKYTGQVDPWNIESIRQAYSGYLQKET